MESVPEQFQPLVQFVVSLTKNENSVLENRLTDDCEVPSLKH
jgi:hypothetical protein